MTPDMKDGDEGDSMDKAKMAEEVTTDRVDMDAEVFRGKVRMLIDEAIASDMDPREVQGVLQNLNQGVPYFYEDAKRYSPNQR